MASHKIYGATLQNVKFGTRTYDKGIVQTEDIDNRVEDEKIIGTEGEKLGGAKYGPDQELSITYISNTLSAETDIDLVGNDATISFAGKTWELFNLQASRSNTGFLTFTARAEWSPDWGSSSGGGNGNGD